jgi:hypothetical protein
LTFQKPLYNSFHNKERNSPMALKEEYMKLRKTHDALMDEHKKLLNSNGTLHDLVVDLLVAHQRGQEEVFNFTFKKLQTLYKTILETP